MNLQLFFNFNPDDDCASFTTIQTGQVSSQGPHGRNHECGCILPAPAVLLMRAAVCTANAFCSITYGRPQATARIKVGPRCGEIRKGLEAAVD